MAFMKVGFLINPIAGMGGRTALKGTDGVEVLEKARSLGAEPVAHKRASIALKLLKNKAELLTCSGEMGEDVLKELGFSSFEVVYEYEPPSMAEDTKRGCEEFLKRGSDIIFFCGGDGTARNVLRIVGDTCPILGIPSGVKMHSAVFGVNPRASAQLLLDFIAGDAGIREAEVMDTDEEKYRSGELSVKHYGYALTPFEPMLVQSGKALFHGGLEEEAKETIAAFALEFMRDGSLYILGPGTTVKKVLELAGLKGTLLGVDVFKDGKLVAVDVNERELLGLLKGKEKAKIVVSPIGSQGFVFGRGNQQISPEVIRDIGRDNIIILSTPHKLRETPFLMVDTGDEELDRELSGDAQVIVGYRLAQKRKIISSYDSDAI
ncbi:MAG: ATP-NAD kinase family protein [Candidatus Hydrothermarchaeales archaeon]